MQSVRGNIRTGVSDYIISNPACLDHAECMWEKQPAESEKNPRTHSQPCSEW